MFSKQKNIYIKINPLALVNRCKTAHDWFVRCWSACHSDLL